MRLIHCKTLVLQEFIGSDVPVYAILSHTWGSEEVSVAEFTTDLAAARSKAGFRKIEYICHQTIADGYEYAWMDTVCIDKTSSAELSEAINSMFDWYKNAVICYAHLSDVGKDNFAHEFPKSRWFTRGWTLQELIAPCEVNFYDAAWLMLGTRREHASLIHKITQIDEQTLEYYMGPKQSHSIARRMAWASRRQTTRIEDMAYCLLGILDINMPLLYGEGSKAFIRLQEEIIKATDDISILAWDLQITEEDFDMADAVADHGAICPILAPSPMNFRNSNNVSHLSSFSAFTMTNLGLELELPLISPDPYGGQRFSVALLPCRQSTSDAFLGILLVPVVGSDVLMHRVGLDASDDGNDGRSPAATFPVGPRWAIDAITRRIVIARSPKLRQHFDDRLNVRKFLMNPPRQADAPRYDITGATSMNFDFDSEVSQHLESATWDPKAGVLTTHDFTKGVSLIEITLQVERDMGRPNQFSVFVDGQNAVIKSGSALSASTKGEIFLGLLNGRFDKMKTAEDLVVSDVHGRQWVLLALVSDVKHVHHWKMSKVDMHMVEVTNLPEIQWADERRRRISELTGSYIY